MKRLFLSALGLAALGSLAAPATTQLREPDAPQPVRPIGADESPETLGYSTDETERMTVSVNIDGQGPYPFIVDTGAERTVIARELAETLNLAGRGDVTLATIAAIRRVPSVHIGELRIGRRTLTDIHAPALERGNLGAMGMLGVDSLSSQRVVFDFGRRQLTLSTAAVEEQTWPADTIVIRGRTRLGRLILTDATVNGQRVRVIVDTGSEVTIGNNALRRRLGSRRRLDEIRVTEVRGVTGDQILAEYTFARRIRLGGVVINNIPIAFADFPIFSHLGLDERPAILLGMDALRMFERVSIDFANRRVRLLPGETSQQRVPVRFAGGATVAVR